MVDGPETSSQLPMMYYGTWLSPPPIDLYAYFFSRETGRTAAFA
jgi:hypothetical protein